MANLLEVGDIIDVRVVCFDQVQSAMNRVRYSIVNSAGTGRTDQSVATFMDDILGPLYKAVMADTAEYIGTQVQIIRPTRRPPVSSTVEAGPGEVSEETLPPQVSALITFRTNTADRHGRGRIYPPFFAESQNASNGRPNAGQIAAMEAIGNAWALSYTAAAGGNSVTFSPVIARADGSLPLFVTSFQAHNFWATQRRRSFASKPDVRPVL